MEFINFKKMSKPYIINDANEMELLENYKINGTPLIEIINELEKCSQIVAIFRF